ncbi:MAG: hypothetical protein K1X81_02915 [Bacteroidia bacterium]|nr:hypothetical protein [Bacteroidia bacterium]
MRSLILTLTAFVLVCLSSCKDKDPEITKTYLLSQEMMDYFVNYAVGTKWVYQDTMDKNNYDTILLATKEEYNEVGNGTLKKGYMLNYTPQKTKNFQIRISPGANNTSYVKVDPLVAAAGAIIFENNNGTWTTGVTYHDSIEITGTKYYQVIRSQSSSDFHAWFTISKNIGCVFFSRMNGGGILANYKLINIIKP